MLQSEERGIWEETPPGKPQVGGEVSCGRLLVRERTLIQLCSMATKIGRNCLLMPGPGGMPAVFRNSDRAANRKARTKIMTREKLQSKNVNFGVNAKNLAGQ